MYTMKHIATQKRTSDEFGVRNPVIQNTCRKKSATYIVARVVNRARLDSENSIKSDKEDEQGGKDR